MLVTIMLHIRIPKRPTAPMVATAIAHLPGQSPHDEPRFVTLLNPRPGSTDARELMIEAVRDAVRARQTT